MSQGSEGHGQPVYAAFIRFLKLLEKILLTRPRAEWQQPEFVLVSDQTIESPLTVVAHAFKTEERLVPHVRVDTTGQGVRELLHRAYERLSSEAFGARTLRFPRYTLAETLMRINLTAEQPARRRRLLARELRHAIWAPTPGDDKEPPPAPSGWLGPVMWLAVAVLPGVLFRMLTSGWLFGAGRRFRWFMNQPYLAPELTPNDFFGFATRLTVQNIDHEDQEQVDLLLVHAFLEDLRIEYLRRPWRPRARLRTACPVLLLDGIARDNGGYDLVRLVNAVRNETSPADPLVIIANSYDVPPDGLAVSDPQVVGKLLPLDGVDGAFAAWRGRLPEARRARHADTWLLRVEIPPVDLRPYLPSIPKIKPSKPRRLPWRILAAIMVLILGGLAVPVADRLNERHDLDCGWPPFESGGLIRTAIHDGQCIGYSDHDRQVFSDDNELVKIQRMIFGQNRQAEQAWQIKQDRPLVTLVYLGSLTLPDALPDEETFAGEREELMGLLAAQYQAYLEANGATFSPYLRIVIANAGDEMVHAAEVVEMLKALAEEDSTVLAVVGMVESREAVRDAIEELSASNIPVIAPTLSADGIAGVSRRYLQISAANVDQAEFVQRYVTGTLGRTKLRNYYTYGSTSQKDGEQSDLYVNTLREDLREQFGEENYDAIYWDGDDLTDACPDRFPDGVVFFGGRYGNFDEFARELANACSPNPPLVIGDDSVNRYMANAGLLNSAPDNLPVAYVAKGALSYCNELGRAEDTERRIFLSNIRESLGICTSADTPVGERVGLAYDATRLLLKAVQSIASDIGPPSAVWEAEQITPNALYTRVKSLADPYRGVSGFTRFGPLGIAEGKRLTLLCVPNLKLAFRGAENMPREIARHPANPEEDRHYGSPPVAARECTTAG